MRSFLTLLLCSLFLVPAWGQEEDPELEAQKRAFLAASGAELAKRVEALKGLTHKSEACVRFLDGVRKTDSDPNLRLAALKQIGVVGVDPAKRILDRVLRTATGNERLMALIGWKELRPPADPARFLEILRRGGGPGVTHIAAEALGNYPRVDAAELLCKLLNEDDVNRLTRRAARVSLRQMVGQDPVDAWFAREAMGKRPPHKRAVPDLLRVASACGHPQIVEAVRRRLRGGPPSQRALAAVALGELEAGKGADAEVSLDHLGPMIDDRREEIVVAAVMAASNIGPVGETLERLKKMAKSGRPGLRALALTALARVKGEAVVELATDGLYADQPAVRFAAVEVLSQQRSKASVAALVDGLKGSDGRLQFEIVRALKHLTRADMGPTYKDWAPWWDSVAETFEPPAADAEIKPGKEVGKTLQRPKYYGSEIVSKRVVFIVDVSGSMVAPMRIPTSTVELTRLGVCQLELRNVIRDLDRHTRFNLIAFANKHQAWKKRLAAARSKKSKKDAQKFVLALSAAGGTNIFDPLAEALDDPAVDTVWLLSDGDPTAGKFVADDEILREVRRLNATRRIAIHTISIGQESPFLKQLAEQNHGAAHVR